MSSGCFTLKNLRLEVFYFEGVGAGNKLNVELYSDGLILTTLSPELMEDFLFLSLGQVWSLTSGALLDTLCGSDVPVTALRFFSGLLLSASSAASSVHMWSLTYDALHKPITHIPAGSAHVAITKDGDQVFYVRHQSQTEVVSWDSRTGQ